jgi:hypothetical protein
MLKQIKSIIENGIRVELKAPTQSQQYPVVVQDITEGSVTKDWSLTYYPRLITKGYTRFYDGRGKFSRLTIARFSKLYERIMDVDRRFLAGENVEAMSNGMRRAIYEFGEVARFVVSSNQNSVTINLNITDPKSPFHMLSVIFRVIDSKLQPGKRHLIGADDTDRWDHNTDTFLEGNATMSPKKKRYLEVFQEDSNSIPYIEAPARLMNGRTEVDPQNSKFLYLQDIDNEYRALAYIYEQNIIRVAMEQALAQYQAQQQMAQQPMNAQGFGFPQGFGAFPQGTFANPQEQQQFHYQSDHQFPGQESVAVGAGQPMNRKMNWSDDLPF